MFLTLTQREGKFMHGRDHHKFSESDAEYNRFLAYSNNTEKKTLLHAVDSSRMSLWSSRHEPVYIATPF
jgi:hypothetical protein